MRLTIVCLTAVLLAACNGNTHSDAGADTAAVDAHADTLPADAAGACGAMTCAANEVCVRRQLAGGACQMPVNGECPPGFSIGAGPPCCQPDPSYTCAARPADCGATVTCLCAIATLCSPGDACGMSTDGQIDCTALPRP